MAAEGKQPSLGHGGEGRGRGMEMDTRKMQTVWAQRQNGCDKRGRYRCPHRTTPRMICHGGLFESQVGICQW